MATNGAIAQVLQEEHAFAKEEPVCFRRPTFPAETCEMLVRCLGEDGEVFAPKDGKMTIDDLCNGLYLQGFDANGSKTGSELLIECMWLNDKQIKFQGGFPIDIAAIKASLDNISGVSLVPEEEYLFERDQNIIAELTKDNVPIDTLKFALMVVDKMWSEYYMQHSGCIFEE